MRKMITESNFNVSINEDDKKRLYIEGIFASADKKNKNGRLYPRNVLEREIKSILESVKDNSCVGELNHPTDRSEIDLNESALKITDLRWEGNDVIGKALVLSTPKGQIVKSLIEDEVKIGISSRGLGTVSEGMVNDDFQLLTWDVVKDPSNYGSFINGILEGKDFSLDNKEIDDLKKEIKLLKEENEKLIKENRILSVEYGFDTYFKKYVENK